MPRMNQLRNPDLSDWKPLPPKESQPDKSLPENTVNTYKRSPFMHASMPLSASTNDALDRQFYGGAALPTYRILPAKKGSDT